MTLAAPSTTRTAGRALVPGDAEEEEYEEPDLPLRLAAPHRRLAASPLLGVARIVAAPFAFWGGDGVARVRPPNYGKGGRNWPRRATPGSRATAALWRRRLS